jgi:uncharacterized protein
MNRSRAIELLRQGKETLASRYGVTGLALFGSTARDGAGDASDVDILVAFDGPATSRRFFGVLFFLEDLLGARVDLVTEKALRPELRPIIEAEAVFV